MSEFGVITFPGSNCDQDAFYALQEELNTPVRAIWHQETDLSGLDGVIVPGGFSYGDYLRCGAIARFSPVMKAVESFAQSGGLVLGICNGFQILCEAGLLPGALVRNEGLKFVCKPVFLRVENNQTPLTSECKPGQLLNIPIAHGEGRYVCDEATLELLNDQKRVLFRYCDVHGGVSSEANPNGSLDAIAGIANERFNVFGMMPHPERACNRLLGSTDGRLLLSSLVGSVKKLAAAKG